MADTIVIGHDGSDASRAALEVAIGLAKDRPGSDLVIACSVHQPSSMVGFPREEILFAADQYLKEMAPIIEKELDAAAESARAAGVKCATACMRGEPAEIIINVAREVNARLIVVGSTGAGLVADLLGSTTTRLLRKSKLPVVVVPKPEK